MKTKEFSSFRDPSGFVYKEDGILYRQINSCYKRQFMNLTESGLYDELISKNVLIEHTIAKSDYDEPNNPIIIKPYYVPFISYPYEWSFSQLKDAALTTLSTHKHALNYGMILKDASAYNIQFINGQAKLIDTLSFDFYEDGMPWIAYGQFCRHFLAPLLLMAEVDIRLSQLMRIYIDGIPIDLASKLLKYKGGFNALQHIHMHAASIKKHSEDGKKDSHKVIKISKFNHLALIDNLLNTIEKIKLKETWTEWSDYYNNTNYTQSAFSHKEEIVSNFIRQLNIKNAWDLGANDGRFSRIAINSGVESVIAFDIDPIAVDLNYNTIKSNKENILPLILDLTNPSPGIGFANRERMQINERQKPDCILALALIHHLAISNNLPFEKIAEWFAHLSDNLIIEFIPKEDSQVKILLATRDDIFVKYTRADFENSFYKYFDLIKSEQIVDSNRTLYLFRRKDLLINEEI